MKYAHVVVACRATCCVVYAYTYTVRVCVHYLLIEQCFHEDLAYDGRVGYVCVLGGTTWRSTVCHMCIHHLAAIPIVAI